MFENLIEIAQNYGIFNFLLPFLLTFSIFYGILRKSKIFGSDEKAERINTIIAFVAAFYILIFTPAGTTLTSFFANFFGWSVIVLLTLFIFGTILFMMYRASGKEKVEAKIPAWILFPIGIGIVVAIFFLSMQTQYFEFLINETLIAIVVVVIIIAIIAILMYEKKPAKSA
jgi:tellurite resistance protein TehA-like permease